VVGLAAASLIFILATILNYYMR
jgi:membrane-associated phospholipid phosphatase